MSTTNKKITFNVNIKPHFYADVRKEVDNYFQSKKISKNANFNMIAKSVFILSSFVSLYLLILFEVFDLNVTLVLAVLLGFFQTLIAFNIAHDAIHGAYSKRRRVNKILGYTFNMVGLSSYMWEITHNRVHHTFTNIPDHDEDLEVAPFFIRLSPNIEYKKLMKFQKYYAFVLYGLASIFWVIVKDFKKMRQEKVGEISLPKHPLKEYFILFVTKLLYIMLFVVLPLYLMDVTIGQFVLGFLCYHLASGVVAGLVFQLAHVVEETTFSLPDEDWNVEESWALTQMKGTANFAMNNRLVTFICGGLNFQVEHHLFPRVCHIHYPEISKIVRKVAQENDVPYNYNDTFIGALQSHYRMLDKFGASPHPRLQRG